MPVVRSAQKKPVRFAAGGAKPTTRWAALDDSSSESECEEKTVTKPTVVSPVRLKEAGPKPLPPLENDPLFVAMSRGDVLWGDICMDIVDVKPTTPVAPVPVRALVTEDALWGQRWAARLEINGGDHYDCSALSDAEWTDCMTWLYAVGWHIWTEGRTGFAAVPDTLPPRMWVPPRPADSHGHKHGHGCCHKEKEKVKVEAPLSAPGADAGRRKGVPVPRFCRAAATCTDEGCRYVHGDTIAVLNKVCGGPRDGPHAGDPAYCTKRCAAVGETPCIYLHPDETWVTGMVRHRPSA